MGPIGWVVEVDDSDRMGIPLASQRICSSALMPDTRNSSGGLPGGTKEAMLGESPLREPHSDPAESVLKPAL